MKKRFTTVLAVLAISLTAVIFFACSNTADNPAPAPVVISDVTAVAMNVTSSHNTVTLTLADGSFKMNIVPATFEFAGTNAEALAAADKYTLIDAKTIAITGLTLAEGSDDVVTVKAAALASKSTGVTAETSEITDLSNVTNAETAESDTIFTITLIEGIFTANLASSDFTFGGTNKT